jgi:hypothetical protein
MIYLEMSRDETHGGGSWSFRNCIWAPTHKKGGGAWPFWSKVSQVREGDTVLHLRGKAHHANFVGYSRASGNGFETTSRPPEPKDWDFANNFYRADLVDFTPFHQPVKLYNVFSARRSELEAYFDVNRGRGPEKRNIFYVRQSSRLQCLNGAYLSDVDDELLTALFGATGAINAPATGAPVVSVETGSQIATVRSRLGQAKFASEIKKLYGYRCCFPGCGMSDPRFLVASHIARWSDNEILRGQLGNGLCFCLVHDKAFELGLFTLDEQFRVFVSPREHSAQSPIARNLLAYHGQQISLADIEPLADALLEHWIRVNIEPFEINSLQLPDVG